MMKRFILILLSIFGILIIYLFVNKDRFVYNMSNSTEIYTQSRHLLKAQLIFDKSMQELALYKINKKTKHLTKAKQYLLGVKGFLSHHEYQEYQPTLEKIFLLNKRVSKLIKTKNFDIEKLILLVQEHKKYVVELDSKIWVNAEKEYTTFIKNKRDYDNYALAFIIIFILIVIAYLKQNIKDQNELKRKNKEIEESLKLFDNGDFILIKWKNKEGWPVEYISKNCKALLGYEVEDFISNKINYAKLIHPNDYDTTVSVVLNSISKKEDSFLHEPYRFKKADGTYLWLYDSTRVIYNENDEATHFIGYIADISKYKERENLFMQQTKLASMGEMIGNIAHQWRQPLNTISMIASGLKFKIEFNMYKEKDAGQDLDKIVEFTQYLSDVIDDFRSFLKKDKKSSIFNINELFDKSLTITESSFKNNDIDLIINTHNEDIYLEGFPNELTQALINILSNAKDAFKEKNSLEDRIVIIDVYKKDANTILTITDNAGGIKEEALSNIFEPYFTTKHQTQGSGLGLYMTHQIIIESFHGKIEAQNKHFKYRNEEYFGAEFKITLPQKS